jgi:hypothetical protein
MKLLCFESLPSTQNFSSADETLAVLALEQTEGRGQRGRTWVSPRGKGLYLSMFHRTEDLSFISLTSVPLYVALALAKWLERDFGVRVAIKWPNDLMWGGYKLGGILCEVALSRLTIGIGLNLQPGGEGTVSLGEISPGSWDPKSLALSWLTFWESTIKVQEDLGEYPAYHLPPGQPWFWGTTGEVLFQDPFLPGDPTLWLSKTPVTSGTHQGIWAYQRGPGRVIPPLILEKGGYVALFESAYDREPKEVVPLDQALETIRVWQARHPKTLGVPGWPIFCPRDARWQSPTGGLAQRVLPLGVKDFDGLRQAALGMN